MLPGLFGAEPAWAASAAVDFGTALLHSSTVASAVQDLPPLARTLLHPTAVQCPQTVPWLPSSPRGRWGARVGGAPGFALPCCAYSTFQCTCSAAPTSPHPPGLLLSSG